MNIRSTYLLNTYAFGKVAVIPTMFDPSSFEIVYATYHVDVGETPFFVVVDYEKQAIVVSIRGTLSLKVRIFLYMILFLNSISQNYWIIRT